ncbi:leucine-rich repeat-containing protein 19 [Coturnix japonica]|uniref:leucine-rich repeat-containing protein 19 n=1 Tax=Coturnix japonica TaxID=93934 RepID=UPI0007770D68|nr:leucine-rich repeat-containing protein 19 [Coturnix japonica]XP_015705392.1 leucine-rich repeat-containing protein 19 [Coturnix japonica]
MKLSWLIIWAGMLLLNQVTADCNITSQTVICDESGKNLTSVPTDLLQNVAELNLKNNKITLKHNDTKILMRLSNLTELYLNENMITLLSNNSFYNLAKLVILDISNNYINTVHQAAFAGLYQLTELNLSYNRITQLDSGVFSSLKNLRVLNLQNNLLESFHIKPSFKLTTITLDGNPWNCSCGLLDLQIWLIASNVIMENENNTVCTFPNLKQKFSIKNATIQPADCETEKLTSETTLPSTYAIKHQSTVFLTAQTSNITGNNGTQAEFPVLGKSWTFLVGVLGFVLSTTLLIFTAIKCPTWYQYLMSYRHRRLEENDPEMFEQEFSADMNSFPAISDTNNEDPIVIFDKTNTSEPEEDGFIEDKYIDTYGTEQS